MEHAQSNGGVNDTQREANNDYLFKKNFKTIKKRESSSGHITNEVLQ